MKDILYPIRCLHGRIYEWWLERKRRFALWKYVTFPLGKKVYILGTPIHTNIGDSAIVLAEKQFLCSAGIAENRIIEITAPQLCQDQKLLAPCIGKRNMICWLGGGNMGNQWLYEERLRRDVMARFPDNLTIIFPQTIYYTPDEEGQLEQEQSVHIYNGRNTLTMVAREQTSYEIMGQLYPDTALLLTPDIVLSATMETFGIESGDRDGVLLCMRSDAERSMTDGDRASVESILRGQGLSFRKTDMHCEGAVTKENRFEHVREKMKEFTSAKLVITDRLHGMVFAAITGTPCIVFSNYNHKVRGTYEWIKFLPYIRYAETVEDVERDLPALLAMENCKYDNAPLVPYFEKLTQVVRDYANN